jgi:hypothetical protein
MPRKRRDGDLFRRHQASSSSTEFRKEAIARIGVIYNAESILKTGHRKDDMASPARSKQSLWADHLAARLGRPQDKGRKWPRNYRFAGC